MTPTHPSPDRAAETQLPLVLIGDDTGQFTIGNVLTASGRLVADVDVADIYCTDGPACGLQDMPR